MIVSLDKAHTISLLDKVRITAGATKEITYAVVTTGADHFFIGNPAAVELRRSAGQFVPFMYSFPPGPTRGRWWVSTILAG